MGCEHVAHWCGERARQLEAALGLLVLLEGLVVGHRS